MSAGRRRGAVAVAAALAVVAVLVAVLVAGRGDRPQVDHLGEGPTSAWVFRPDGDGRPKGVVLFLHGWGAASPRPYRPWIDHLVAGGRIVVYPQYQAPPFLSPGTAFAGVVRGVRRAIDDGDVPRDVPWAVTGHSAGGAMAADFAAAAPQLGLPRPRAVAAFFPGRRLPRFPLGIPALSLDLVPDGTRVVAFAGDDDRTVGTAEARRIGRLGRFVLVTDDRLDDHLAPQRVTGPRSYFWRALDALLNGASPSQVPDAP